MEPAFILPYRVSDAVTEYKNQIDSFRESIRQYAEEFKDESYVKYALVSDNFCLKFLRARKYNVEEAVKLYGETLEHRKKYDLDHILDKPDPVVRYLATRYPHAFAGYGHGYRPIYVECIGDIDATAMTEESSFEQLLHYHRWMQEFLHRKVISRANYLRKAKSRGEESDDLFEQIDQMVFITNIGSASMSTLKSVDYLKAIAKEDSIGYPELLYKTWIINAGFIFKAAYTIAKPFLDPGTTAKFNIFRSDASAEMSEELGSEYLPEFLGGTAVPRQVTNFKYTGTLEEMAAKEKEKKEQLKQIAKEKKAGTYVEPPLEEKFAVPPVEIVPYDPEDERVKTLRSYATAKGEDTSMWMRMTVNFTPEVLYCAEHGLEAFEAKYEPEYAELRAIARSGNAIEGGYTLPKST